MLEVTDKESHLTILNADVSCLQSVCKCLMLWLQCLNLNAGKKKLLPIGRPFAVLRASES